MIDGSIARASKERNLTQEVAAIASFLASPNPDWSEATITDRRPHPDASGLVWFGFQPALPGPLAACARRLPVACTPYQPTTSCLVSVARAKRIRPHVCSLCGQTRAGQLCSVVHAPPISAPQFLITRWRHRARPSPKSLRATSNYSTSLLVWPLFH